VGVHQVDAKNQQQGRVKENSRPENKKKAGTRRKKLRIKPSGAPVTGQVKHKIIRGHQMNERQAANTITGKTGKGGGNGELQW